MPDLGLLKPDSVYLLSDFPVNEEEVEAVEV